MLQSSVSSQKKLLERRTNFMELNRSKSFKKSFSRHDSPKFLPTDMLKQPQTTEATSARIDVNHILTKDVKLNTRNPQKNAGQEDQTHEIDSVKIIGWHMRGQTIA